ncbi:hypothetical protein ZEAMMB73_Zm00001d013454 [Zea mays]|uniref:DUF4283 domain-containing protein n=1 Tax=Zea mays TaxID=4577 RepID=A0A1D6GJM5_MAIZE|nr:hypothetical protein ZEAMMB73_Zm00001d013454 [Zea mays]
MAGVGEAAIEGGRPSVWRLADRRGQAGSNSGRDRFQTVDRRALRGRGPRLDRGRGSWRGRGGRFGGRSFLESDRRVIRDMPESSRGVVSSNAFDEDAKKRAADTVDDGALADGKGKKRREDLCCEICEGDHVPLDCQVYNGPKPHAILCGFGSGESGFFQIPNFGSKGLIPLKESSTAFITAKEGTITAELVKSELAHLIPVRWTWAVQSHANGFVVPFPSKVELQRMVAMKYVHAAYGKSIMVIQELEQKIEPVQHLEKAWVNIYGVPYEIRSFLPLWAVGTIIGATQKVDLRYTKRMGVVRLLVGVTNVDKIPESIDIVVGEGLYEIFFKIDKVCKDGVWSEYYYPSDKKDDYFESKDEDFDGLDNIQPKFDDTTKDTVMKDVSGSKVDNSSNVQHATQQNCDIRQTGVPSDFGSLAQSTESFIPHINTSSLDCPVALEKCLVAVNRSSVFRENVAAPTAVAHGVVYDNKWTEAKGTIILNAKQTAQKER